MVCLFAGISSEVLAADKTFNNANANNSFADGGNWTPSAPVAGDNLIIAAPCTYNVATADLYNNFTVTSSITFTIGNDTTARSLNVAGNVLVDTGSSIAVGAFNATHTFAIGGDLTNNGAFNMFTAAGQVANVSMSGAAKSISGTGTPNFNNLAISGTITQSVNITAQGSLSVTGGSFTGGASNLTVGDVSITGGTFTAPSTGTFNVNGNWSVTATFAHNNGTVNFTGGTQTLASGGQSFNNLTNNTTTSLQLTAALTCGGTVTNTGGNFDTNSQTMSAANLTVNGGTFTGTTMTLTVSGNVSLTNGTLVSASTFNVGGNWSRTGGTFTHNSGTVVFNGTTQTLDSGGQSFNNVTSSSSTSLTLSNSALTCAGTLTVTTGTFSISTLGATASSLAATAGTISGASTLTVNGAGTNISGAGNINCTTLAISGDKSITGGSNLSIAAAITLATATNVTNNGSVTSSSSSGIAGADATSVWTNAAGSALTIAGPLLTTGTLTASANANTVTYNSTTAGQAVKTPSASTYHHLTINNTGQTATVGAALTINGTLTCSAGTLSAGANALDANGDVTISGGTLSAPSTTMTIAGNFSRTAGTFTHNSGTVTFDGTTQTLNSGGQSFNNLTNSAGTSLQVTATLTCAGTLSNTSGNFDTNAQSVTAAALSVSGGTFTGSAAALDVNGNVTISGGTLTAPPAGQNFTISGNWSRTAGTFTHNSGTVTFDGTTQTLDSGGQSFNNIAAASTTSQTLSNSALTCAGTLTKSAAGSFNTNSLGVTVAALSVTAGTFTGTAASLDVSGNVTISGGTLTAPSAGGSFTIGGNFSRTAGTFTHNSGTVTFTGATATLNPNTQSFNSITTNAGAVVTLTSALTCASNFTNGGTIALSSFNWTVSGTFSNNGTVRLNGTETLSITQDIDSGTFRYVGDGAGGGTAFSFYTMGATDYFNVEVAGDAAETFSATNTIVIVGTFTISSGTYATGTRATTVTGLTTLSGGTYSAGSNAQTFNGGLTISGGTYTGSTGDLVTTSMTLSSGTLTAPSGAFTVSGNWTRDAGTTFTPGAGANTVSFTGLNTTLGGTQSPQTFNRITLNKTALINTLTVNITDLTVSSNLLLSQGTFVAPTGTLSVGGNFTATAAVSTFTHNSGTVDFTGASQTIAGSSTFNHFKKVNVGSTLLFTTATTQTVAATGSFTITGSSGNQIIIDSTSNAQHNLIVTAGATISVSFVDVQYSNASGGQTISATNSTDSGNTTNWSIASPPATWTGGTSTAWNTASNWSTGIVPGAGTDVTIPDVANDPILSTAKSVKSITTNAGATISNGGTAAATLTITGASVDHNGSFISTITVILGGTTAKTIKGTGTYINLQQNSSGTATLDATLTTLSATTLTVTTGTFDANGKNVTVAGSLSVATGATFTTSGSGTVTMNATGNLGGAGSFTAYNLTVAAGTTTLAGNATVNNTLTVSGGATLNGGAAGNTFFLTGTGTPFVVTGTFTAASGTVNYSGSGTQAVTNTTYATLVTSGGGTSQLPATVTSSGSQTFNDNVELTANTVCTSTGNAAIAFNGTVFNAASQTLTVNTNGATTFAGPVGAGTALASLTTNAGGAATSISSDVSTTGTQTFGDAVVLVSNVTLTFTGTTVTFTSNVNGTSNGAHNLAVSGDASFGAQAGNTTPLGSISVSGTTSMNGGAITNTTGGQTGAQTYTGAVTLTGAAAITATTVSFNSTVEGAAQTLTITGNANFGDGANDFVGDAAALTSVSVSGSANFRAGAGANGTVRTSGAQSYGASVLFADSRFNSTGGTVTFTSTLDGNADGTESLTITGNASFGGSVGNTAGKALEFVNVSGTTAMNAANITSKTPGTQTYTGAVTLGADATLTTNGGAVSFGSTVNGSGGQGVRSLTSSANTTFGGIVGGTTRLKFLSVGGTATLNAGCTSIATDTAGGGTGAQTYTGAVTINADTTFAATGNGDITFTSTVNAFDATDRALTVNTTGATVFGSAIGGTFDFSTVTTNAGGTVSIGGNVTSSGAQTYSEPATLAATSILAGSTVTFSNTLTGAAAGAQNLTVTGNAVFSNVVGATALGQVSVSGTTSLANNVSTTGTQTYSGNATLTGGANLTGTTVTFNGTVDGGFGLTVTGNAVFGDGAGDFVGNGSIVASLTVTGTATLNAGNASTTVLTTNAQSYGALVLGNDTTLQSNNVGISITGTVNSSNATARVFIVNTTAATTLGGIVGGSFPLASLTTNAGGTTSIGANVTTTTGGQTYGDAVSLTSTVTLASNAGTTVAFSSTVNGAAAGTQGMSITSNATFASNVGATNSLLSLAITGTTSLSAGTTTVTTSTTQTYTGNVTLAAGTTSMNGSTISFGGTVNGTAAGAQTLAVTGAAVFGDGAGDFVGNTTALAAVSVTGNTTFNAGNAGPTNTVTTTAAAGQVYASATLGANTTLNAGANPITFSGAISSPGTAFALSTTTTGTTTLGGAIGGGGNPLSDLTVVTGTGLTLNNITLTGTLDLNPTTGGVSQTGGTTVTAANLALRGGSGGASDNYTIANATNNINGHLAAAVNMGAGRTLRVRSTTNLIIGTINGLTGMTTQSGNIIVDANTITVNHSINTTPGTGGAFSSQAGVTINVAPTIGLGNLALNDSGAPAVLSISRQTPAAAVTNATSLTYLVTYSEDVVGVTTTNFSLTLTGTATGTINSVSGSNSTRTVNITGVSGDGTLQLRMANSTGVTDAAFNAVIGLPFTTGDVYTIDNTAPFVSSINRAMANPTNQASVTYTVTFDSPVTGVNPVAAFSDFSITATLVTGAAVTAVSADTLSTTRTVTVSTGTGDGQLELILIDDDTIMDQAGNRLGGTGSGNGNFTGQRYDVDKTAPAAPVLTAITTDTGPVDLITTDTTLTISGTGENGATIALSRGGVPKGTPVVVAGGVWSIADPDTLADGVYTYTATAQDVATNVSPTSANFVVTVDLVDPTIGPISNMTTNEDTATASVNFNVNDNVTAAAALVVTCTNSTNVALIPTANVTLGGAGATRTVVITPVANLFGSSTITLTVTDAAQRTGTVNFLVTVNPVADTPTATAGVTTNEDTLSGAGLIKLVRNAVDGAEVTHFKITSASNCSVFLNDGVTPVSVGTFVTFAQANTQGLRIMPTANFPTVTPGTHPVSGVASFDFQASTAGSDGGVGGSAVNQPVTVIEINDPPVITADAKLTFDPNFAPDQITGVALPKQPVSFTVVASDVDDALTVSWDFGDATAAGSGQTVTHTYASAGSYTVKNIVTDGRSPQVERNQTIVVNTPPRLASGPSVLFNPIAFNEVQSFFTTPQGGGTVTDEDGDLLTFVWNFGDTSTPIVSNAATATHTYILAGVPKELFTSGGTALITATVTITDDGRGANKGSITKSVQFLVLNPFGLGNVTDDIPAGNPANGISITSKGANGALRFDISGAGDFPRITIFPQDGGVSPANPITGKTFFALFRKPGIYVVTVDDGKGNIARKMIPITLIESQGGQRTNDAFSVDQTFITGRFNLESPKDDSVQFRGRFPLKAASYPAGEHIIAVGIGNVVAYCSVDAKGSGRGLTVVNAKGEDVGASAVKKFRFKYNSKKQTASLDLMLKFPEMDLAGFDSEGVLSSFAPENTKGELRLLNIPVVVLIDNNVSLASRIPAGFTVRNGTAQVVGSKK